MRPAYEIKRILKRLSRERWLSPHDVLRIGRRLAAPGKLPKDAFAIECQRVGMLRGRPPAFAWEPHYKHVVKATQSRFPELTLLKCAHPYPHPHYERAVMPTSAEIPTPQTTGELRAQLCALFAAARNGHVSSSHIRDAVSIANQLHLSLSVELKRRPHSIKLGEMPLS